MTRKYILAGLLVASYLVSACETLDDSLRTKSQAAGIGAAVCAALAIGLTKCDDDDPNCDEAKKRRKNALIAGLVCGVAGYAYGSHVASKKEQYASQESYLDAVIAEANRVHDEAVQSNSALASELATLDWKIQQAQANLSNSEQSRDELSGLQQDLKNQYSAANTRLKVLEREIEIQKAVIEKEKDEISPSYHARAVSAVSSLEGQSESLKRYIAQMEAIDDRIIR